MISRPGKLRNEKGETETDPVAQQASAIL